jgi:hypothetical protein
VYAVLLKKLNFSHRKHVGQFADHLEAESAAVAADLAKEVAALSMDPAGRAQPRADTGQRAPSGVSGFSF